MSHPEKMLNSFDEKFWKLTKEDNASYAMNGREGKQIKHFLLSSHLSYLLESKKKLEGELRDIPYAPETEQIKIDKIWNSALTQQIAVLEQEIKEVEELNKK